MNVRKVKSCGRCWGQLLLVEVCLLLFCFLFVLFGSAFLFKENSLVGGQGVDVVIPLLGSPSARVQETLKVVQAHPRAKFLIARETEGALHRRGLRLNEADMLRRFLIEGGIDEQRILVNDLNLVNSTRDEAQSHLEYLKQNKLGTRVAVVTSWYHTRRAAWLFRSYFTPIGLSIFIVPAEEEKFSSERWWTSEEGVVAVGFEYLKWFHNLVHLERWLF